MSYALFQDTPPDDASSSQMLPVGHLRDDATTSPYNDSLSFCHDIFCKLPFSPLNIVRVQETPAVQASWYDFPKLSASYTQTLVPERRDLASFCSTIAVQLAFSTVLLLWEFDEQHMQNKTRTIETSRILTSQSRPDGQKSKVILYKISLTCCMCFQPGLAR